MRDDQLSFFGAPAEAPAEDSDQGPPEAGPPERKIESVAEVVELAAEVFGAKAQPGAQPDEAKLEPPALARARTRRLEKAEELGLVARWADYSKAKGHVAVHDPTSGGRHDLPWKDAPGWAQREAVQRSSLYRSSGDAGAFDLTAAQIEEIWEEEHPAEEVEEGIVEEYELPDD
jgi:hypothetical protein